MLSLPRCLFVLGLAAALAGAGFVIRSDDSNAVPQSSDPTAARSQPSSPARESSGIDRSDSAAIGEVERVSRSTESNVDFSTYPVDVASLFTALAEEFDGSDAATQLGLVERLEFLEPSWSTDLLAYGPGLFHALWERAPQLREDARDLFSESENAFTQRVLLQAIIQDTRDHDEAFADIEYDIFDVAVSTKTPNLLVDCVANVCNRRNLDIHRASLDFALALDPRDYGVDQHPGIDAVLNSYEAVGTLYRNDEVVMQQLREDLEYVTTFPDVNAFQFRRALELLSRAGNDDRVEALVDDGRRSADPDIARYCRDRTDVVANR